MKIIFIRHGATWGNTQKRYIGTTDEELLNESVKEIKSHRYPKAEVVFSSPMKRCVQTANIIYGKYSIIEDLKEIDFGDFENKNYKELEDNADYQNWIDSMGALPFPNGESNENFKSRCINAFLQAIKGEDSTTAFVVHGGTIMSILECFSEEKSNFYDWQVENANGFTVDFIDEKMRNIKKIW